jgi:hypothetical protein
MRMVSIAEQRSPVCRQIDITNHLASSLEEPQK